MGNKSSKSVEISNNILREQSVIKIQRWWRNVKEKSIEYSDVTNMYSESDEDTLQTTNGNIFNEIVNAIFFPFGLMIVAIETMFETLYDYIIYTGENYTADFEYSQIHDTDAEGTYTEVEGDIDTEVEDDTDTEVEDDAEGESSDAILLNRDVISIKEFEF